MLGRNVSAVVAASCLSFPDERRDKTFLAKNLVQQHTKRHDFTIVDAREHDPLVSKQITGKIESRVHHVQPLRMEAAAGFRVGAELPALSVDLAGVLEIGLQRFAVIVRVNEIVPGVVWWVD